MDSKKWVVCLGGSDSKIPIIQAVQDRGMRCAVVDHDSDSPAKRYADLFLNISIFDSVAIIDALKQANILHATAFVFAYTSLQEGQLSASRLTKGLNIPINLKESWLENSWNKIAFKRFCSATGITTPAFTESLQGGGTHMFLERYGKAVCKPIEGGVGSKSVFFVDMLNDEQVIDNSCFLEQYIDGDLYSYNGIAIKEEVPFSLVLRKYTRTDGKNIAGFSSRVDRKLGARIINQCKVAALSMHLRDTFFHFDILVRDGVSYFIDFGLLLDCRVNELLLYGGFNAYGYILDEVLNLPTIEHVRYTKNETETAIAFVYPIQEGRLRSLPTSLSTVLPGCSAYIWKKEGDFVKVEGTVEDEIGYVVGRDVDWSKVKNVADMLEEEIIIEPV